MVCLRFEPMTAVSNGGRPLETIVVAKYLVIFPAFEICTFAQRRTKEQKTRTFQQTNKKKETKWRR